MYSYLYNSKRERGRVKGLSEEDSDHRTLTVTKVAPSVSSVLRPSGLSHSVSVFCLRRVVSHSVKTECRVELLLSFIYRTSALVLVLHLPEVQIWNTPVPNVELLGSTFVCLLTRFLFSLVVSRQVHPDGPIPPILQERTWS